MHDHIIFYRIGQFLALSLPLKIGYGLAVLISDLRYLFAKADRLNVTANLKTIFPEKSNSEIARIKLEMFRNFAKYIVDFLRFPKLDSNYIKKNIRTENIHYVEEALAKGKGVIALSAHIGNWELGGAVMGILGYPIWAVVLPHKDKRVNNFFDSQRESKNFHAIPLGRAARQCLKALAENKIVALIGDRDFTKKGLVMEFFGRPTFLPEGPALFSLKTGSPIVPTFMIKNKDDSFTFIFEKPIEFKPTGDRKNDIKELTLKDKHIIEIYIKKYPQQWFMFRKFWVEY